MDAAEALQTGVVTALLADSRLRAIAAVCTAAGEPKVYDTVPLDANGKMAGVFPYLTIGTIQVTPDLDTDDDQTCIEDAEAFITIDAWSRYKSGIEVKQIGAAAVRCLKRQILLPGGWAVVVSECVTQIYNSRESDGLTRHGVLTFRYEIEAS